MFKVKKFSKESQINDFPFIPSWYSYLENDLVEGYNLIARPKGKRELPLHLAVTNSKGPYSNNPKWNISGSLNRKPIEIRYLIPSYKHHGWYIGYIRNLSKEQLILIRFREKKLDLFIYPYQPNIRKQSYSILNGFGSSWKL